MAFYSCSSLSCVTIPDNLTTIGNQAFDSCTSLTSLTIPNSVTGCGYYVFNNCLSLTNVTIGNGISSIKGAMFGGCTNLNYIDLPNSVTNIGQNAFNGCSSLQGVFFKGDAPTLDMNAFAGCNVVVYYLPGATGWDKWVSPPPAVLWNPQPQGISIQANQLGFTIAGSPSIPIAVEACTNLANASWSPLQTCTLTNGSIYFNDPDWTNYPTRLYRIRSP